MVSLDDAVLARLEKGGKRYEALVDPDLVEQWKEDSSNIQLDDFMAMDEIFHDARAGERPTEEALMNSFETLDVETILNIILDKGSIQLTTAQRKARVEHMRQQIIHHIHSQAIDPKSKSPHPRTRIELALQESKYSVDPFKRLEEQIKDAIAKLKPLIPLSFESVRLAFRSSWQCVRLGESTFTNLSEERRLARKRRLGVCYRDSCGNERRHYWPSFEAFQRC